MGEGAAIRISNGSHQGNAVKRSVYNHFPLEKRTLCTPNVSQQQVYALKCLLCSLGTGVFKY